MMTRQTEISVGCVGGEWFGVVRATVVAVASYVVRYCTFACAMCSFQVISVYPDKTFA